MTRVLSLLRSFTRAERVVRGCIGLALVLVAWACADKITGPPVVTPKGQVGVYADVGTTGVTTLVIQISGPGIVKPDGSPDTLAFNIPLTNGVASGSLDVPAGPDRLITARAFIGVAETHRGSVTANILEGSNPTLNITLVPLVGSLPITVSIGSTIVVVRPLVASVAVGDTLRLTSEIRDYNGTILNERVRWATLNPLKATVDTAGLVTVRDTGSVQIVGTYGTVGGASTITGSSQLATSPFQLIWNGSVNTNWSEINNWTPVGLGAARVPTLADSVIIPASAPQMPRLDGCVDNNAVRDILLEQGATLTTSCYPLNVYNSAVVRGTMSANVNLRPNATAAGTFQSLYIYGSGTSLADSVSATYVEVRIPVGTFSLNGHKLRTNDLNVFDGTITMTEPDTIIVANTINWQGDDENGLLSGGVILFRGTSFAGSRYFATGTNRVVLDRTTAGTQQISGFDYVNSPANSQIRRLEIRNRDGVDICGYLRVTDTLSLTSTGTPATLSSCSSYRIRADGPVITSANTDVANYQWELMHPTGTSLVAGTWHPTYTDFEVDGQLIKPTLAYGNLRFFANNALPANMSITGFLYLQGAAIELDFAGHKLQVGNYVETQDGALLKMTNAADSLLIGEYLNMPEDIHAGQKAKLTAGVITVGAYLEGTGFASAGTKVVMTGTSANTSKYINSLNSDTRPTQEMYDLEIAAGASYGLCAKVRVAHDLTVRTGAHLGNWCGSPTIVLQNDLVTEAASSFDPSFVVLNSAIGTSHVLGAFSPGETQFTAASAVVKPGLAYQSVKIFAPTQLTGATTLTGFLDINGAGANLTVNGQALTIGNYLQVENGGTLTMTNAADAVTVAEYANFSSENSAVHNGTLTAGTLTVGAYFEGTGFSASGTHTVVMSGTSANTSKYINNLNYETRLAQGFQNLEIASGATYGLCARVAVHGSLTVRSGATLQDWCGSPYLRLDGDLVGEASSTIKPFNVVLNSTSGTDNVAGTFTPPLTTINSSVVVGHIKVGLGYKDMQFLAPISLNDNLSVAGDLTVTGAASILTLNGKQLTITGNLSLQSSATVVMNNALDVLDISGAASWNSGASEAGKLTAGTTIFRGPTFCATNYETSGTHKTVFDRAGTAVRLQCVSSNGTSQPMWNVDVKGAGVSLENYMNVTNDIHVFAGATLNETGGSGTLWVGHTLTTDAESAVTNGPSYPSTTKLTVVFEDPSGTQNVAGAYSPDQTWFTALNSFIQPTNASNSIDYKYVRIDQSTTFQDSTEIDGNFDIVNTAIVSLGGHPVVVHGGMSLPSSSTARLKMVDPNDVLTVGLSDPSASLIWNGGDNATDGSGTLLLTNGTIFFYGNNFQGNKYSAAPGTAHKFVFAGTSTSGSVSLNSNPTFANLQLSNARPVTNNGSTQISDQLTIDASRVLNGTGTVNVNGALVTVAGSDIALVGTVNVSGPNGTSAVAGGFHPSTTVFSAASPIAGALKAGLTYNTVNIAGPYQLNGTTAFANGFSVSGSGVLNMNGNTLNVTGNVDLNSGGVLNMSSTSDVLNITGQIQFQGTAGLSVLTAGTMTVGGAFINNKTGLDATGSHTLVLNGATAQSITTSSGAQKLRNVTVSGLGSVNFSGGAGITGNFNVASATTVTANGTLDIDGTLTTAAGSAFNPNNLDVSDAGGTNGVGGSMSISGTTTFSGGTQTIKVGGGINYTNMTIGTGSISSVSGGALTLPAASTLTVSSGGTLDVPTGSALGNATVNGTLNFIGTSVSTQTLTINSGGLTHAIASDALTFIDFGRIVNNGTLNNGDRADGAGGFRYKTTGSPSGLSGSGTFIGNPVGQP